MPPWMVKAAVQGVLSRLPEPQRWNRLFQRATGSLELTDQFFETKVGYSRRHLHLYRQHRGQGSPPSVVVELGTGWFPVAPIALALYGAPRVYSVDMQDLLAHERVVATLERFALYAREDRFVPGDPDRFGMLDDLLRRASSLTPQQLLAEIGVTPLITDARSLEFVPGSVDLFVSNNTFEHIPEDVLAAILREFRRVAAPDAVSSHYVDMADHYAHFDRSITVYNFLKYSDRAWRLFNNDLQFQNRLRLPDYRRLHDATGWDVVDEDNVAHPPDVLDAVRLAPEFRRYARTDLLAYKTWMVSRPGHG